MSQVYSTGLITTFSLVSTWLIVVTAAMRYVATCYPLRVGGRVSGHANGCVAIALTYTVCILCNVPSFFILRINDLASTDVVSVGGGGGGGSGSGYDVAGDEEFVDEEMFGGELFLPVGGSNASNASDVKMQRLIIDFGSFSHMTNQGLVFHWIKAFFSIFIPGRNLRIEYQRYFVI